MVPRLPNGFVSGYVFPSTIWFTGSDNPEAVRVPVPDGHVEPAAHVRVAPLAIVTVLPLGAVRFPGNVIAASSETTGVVVPVATSI